LKRIASIVIVQDVSFDKIHRSLDTHTWSSRETSLNSLIDCFPTLASPSTTHFYTELVNSVFIF